MLFNSWPFFFFLLVLNPIYYCLPKLGFGSLAQISLLFIASLIFYSFETPSLVFLLLGSLIINCYISRLIVLSSNRFFKGNKLLVTAVIINLAILAFFKYASLLADLVLPDQYFFPLKDFLNDIPLPIGISFYTFQAISLVVDLNKKDLDGTQSLEQDFQSNNNVVGFTKIAFFISFFPQLVAGPIVKAHDFIDQISTKCFSNICWSTVTTNLIIGYFLKMVIADNLKDVTYLLNTERLYQLGKVDLIVLLYGYSFQIFADFAGYSLIAIGLGALFGYKFPINFNFPYISQSITEFWRRWHISLSSFLRDYLYVSLGGNRKGKVRTYTNLFIVMFLGGLWHGAAWSYAIWGTAHGTILAIEKFYKDIRSPRPIAESSHFTKIIRIVMTFHIVSLLWLLFLMPNFDNVINYFSHITETDKYIKSPQYLFIVLFYGLMIVIYHIFAYLNEHTSLLKHDSGKQLNARYALFLSFLLTMILVNSGTNGEFIYFQF